MQSWKLPTKCEVSAQFKIQEIKNNIIPVCHTGDPSSAKAQRALELLLLGEQVCDQHLIGTSGRWLAGLFFTAANPSPADKKAKTQNAPSHTILTSFTAFRDSPYPPQRHKPQRLRVGVHPGQITLAQPFPLINIQHLHVVQQLHSG